MKQLILGVALLIIGSPFFKAYSQNGFPQNGPPDQRGNYIAYTHGNIQVNPNTLLNDATLIVKDGLIEGVGKDLAIPKNAQVVNLQGRYVYPSFIETYSAYGISNIKEKKGKRIQQYSNNNPGAYAWNDALHPNHRAAETFEYDEKGSEQLLASGFGVSLSAIQDGIFRGSAALVLTGKGKEHELILNADAATTMSFNKGSSQQDYPGSAMGVVALIRQTYYDADYYEKQGKKEELNLSFENFAKLKSLPCIFETENKFATLRAGQIAKEFGLKYIYKSQGDDYQRINEIKALNAPLLLPLNFPGPYEVEDVFDAERVSLADLKHWELAPSNPSQIKAAGIPFAITSSGTKSSDAFLKNLRKAVQYGLSKEDALTALTLTPANLLNIGTISGSLKKGMLANFFIADKDLFEKDASILEHHIKGKRNTLKSWQQAIIAGNYLFESSGFSNSRLQIKAEKQNEGMILSSDTIKFNLTNSAGIYSFSYTNKSKQLSRGEFWVGEVNAANQATLIRGVIYHVDGSSQSFKASLELPLTASNTKKDSAQTISYGSIVYPFSEYGSATLPKAESILFKNATVWTNEKEGKIKTDVWVKDGKIAGIGQGLSASGAKVIEAEGKHLTTGIIDEHSHIAIYRGVNECTQNITAEVRIGDVVNPDDINIYRQLSGGVVACQQLHGSCNPIGGQSSIIKLHWGVAPEEMKIKGADGFIKFALGENVKQSNWSNEGSRYPQTRMGVEQVYYDAFKRARAYEKAKKEKPALTRNDLEMETLLEILNKKRFISCHSYVQSEINMLMHVADSLGFRVNTFTHILEGYKVADKMKIHGVHASTFADWWAYKFEVIEAIPQNASILQQVGVTTAVNSDDAEMGRRLNQEAAKMIKYGKISEEEAWKMVTLNPAIMLHLDNKMGSIKVGKDADIVLWNDNPLSIYARVEMTLVDGIPYYSLERDAQLRKEILAERNRIIQKMISAKQKGEKTETKVSQEDPDYRCDTVE